MSKSREAVKRWRNKTKGRMIQAMGGSCVCCGYNRCPDAMEFHHIDPAHKDFAFGSLRANPSAWPKVVEELRKCVLLCSRCHREIHAGMIELPNDHAIFDESYAEYQLSDFHQMTACPVCGGTKPSTQRTCSLSCGAKMKGLDMRWEQIDLIELLKTKTLTEVAETLDTSLQSIYKRLRKMGHQTTAPYDKWAPQAGLEPTTP